jgi:hypothetical protein
MGGRFFFALRKNPWYDSPQENAGVVTIQYDAEHPLNCADNAIGVRS